MSHLFRQFARPKRRARSNFRTNPLAGPAPQASASWLGEAGALDDRPRHGARAHLQSLHGVWQRHRLLRLSSVAVACSLLVAGVASAATSTVSLQPGDSVTVSCPQSSLSVSSSSSTQDVLACQALPELVVKSVTASPADPVAGQAVTFSATVENEGTVATPKAFGTAFFVDGTKVTWYDANAPLAAGATATYTADDGPTGSATWTATAGTHSIEADTNDMALFSEMPGSDNTMTMSLTVSASDSSSSAASATTTTTAPTTTTTTTTSSGTMSPPSGYSSSQLIFDDTFSGTTLDTSHWHTYISDYNSGGSPWNSNGSGGSGSNAGGYDAEYFEPSAVSVDNGLSLTATQGSNESGYTWTSGVVSTQGLFSISQGYVQVKAWMPDMTTGMWPGIWFMGENSELPEIDLYEGGYTPNPNSAFAANLHVSGDSQDIVQSGVDLASGWHVYGIDYEPGKSLTYYLDGQEVAQYTTNVPTGPYFLLLDLQVAQNASGWHSLVGSSTPSPSVMKVAEVQAYGTAG